MISIFMAFEGVYSIIPTAFTDSGHLTPARVPAWVTSQKGLAWISV